jgi:hypothetical protein
VDPQTVSVRVNQTGAFKIRKMARHFGLRELEHRHQIAHASFAAAKQIEQAEPAGIGERFKYLIDG